MALFPTLANTSGSSNSPGRLFVGVAGDLKCLFGDNPLVDPVLAGDALEEAEGDAGDLGEGDLLNVGLGPDVRRLVGLFILGEAGGPRPPPGDFDLFLGEFGIERELVDGCPNDCDIDVIRLVGLFKLGEPSCPLFIPGDLDLALGEFGIPRELVDDLTISCPPQHPPPDDSNFREVAGELGRDSSDSRSSLLFLNPSGFIFLILLVSSPTPMSFSPRKLLLILGEPVLASPPITGLLGAELVRDILMEPQGSEG